MKSKIGIVICLIVAVLTGSVFAESTISMKYKVEVLADHVIAVYGNGEYTPGEKVRIGIFLEEGYENSRVERTTIGIDKIRLIKSVNNKGYVEFIMPDKDVRIELKLTKVEEPEVEEIVPKTEDNTQKYGSIKIAKTNEFISLFSDRFEVILPIGCLEEYNLTYSNIEKFLNGCEKVYNEYEKLYVGADIDKIGQRIMIKAEDDENLPEISNACASWMTTKYEKNTFAIYIKNIDKGFPATVLHEVGHIFELKDGCDNYVWHDEFFAELGQKYLFDNSKIKIAGLGVTKTKKENEKSIEKHYKESKESGFWRTEGWKGYYALDYFFMHITNKYGWDEIIETFTDMTKKEEFSSDFEKFEGFLVVLSNKVGEDVSKNIPAEDMKYIKNYIKYGLEYDGEVIDSNIEDDSKENTDTETLTNCNICNSKTEWFQTETLHINRCTKDISHVFRIEGHRFDSNNKCEDCEYSSKKKYKSNFKDFQDSNHWAWRNVCYMAEEGIVKGTYNEEDKTYSLKPDDTITAEAFMALLARILGYKGEVIDTVNYMPIDSGWWSVGEWKYLMNYIDKNTNKDAKKEIQRVLADNGTSGSDEEIKKNYRSNITREKAGYLISIFLESNQRNYTLADKFVDWNDVESYYKDSQYRLSAYDILRGIPEDGKLYMKPKKSITRVEAITIIDRFNSVLKAEVKYN